MHTGINWGPPLRIEIGTMKAENESSNKNLRPVVPGVDRFPRGSGHASNYGIGSFPKSPLSKTALVTEKVSTILNWPTDTVSIDHCDLSSGDKKWHYAHTVFLFIPGNPGCVGWYTPMLLEVVNRMGVGFAARGLSYAGHGLDSDISNVEQWEHSTTSVDNEKSRNVHIPWTLDGQIQHKIAWIDQVANELKDLEISGTAERNGVKNISLPRYIFISHSIGSHMVERLCILRPDILQKTSQVIHLMPFIRNDAPSPQKTQMAVAANHQTAIISVSKTISRFLSLLPISVVDYSMRIAVPEVNGRKLAVGLARQPTFARNFFELGLEEMRDVPERPDDSALRFIARVCPIMMIYGGGPDHWAPKFHMDDLLDLQQKGCIPKNVHWTYSPDLVHGFPVFPAMVTSIVNFICSAAKIIPILNMRSKL